MDRFLARSLGAAALLAGVGVFYHYVVYLPGLEQAKKAEEADAAALIERQQEQRASQYQACMATARGNYGLNWAKACQANAATRTRQMRTCLSSPSIMTNPYMGKSWCEQQYGGIDASADCTLPGGAADGVNKYLADELELCEKAAKLGA